MNHCSVLFDSDSVCTQQYLYSGGSVFMLGSLLSDLTVVQASLNHS